MAAITRTPHQKTLLCPLMTWPLVRPPLAAVINFAAALLRRTVKLMCSGYLKSILVAVNSADLRILNAKERAFERTTP